MSNKYIYVFYRGESVQFVGTDSECSKHFGMNLRSVLRELSSNGFVGRFQRESIDNVIAEHWDQNMKDFCTSMQIASISASQAAQVISAFVILQERKA